jgi:hypothetical protein
VGRGAQRERGGTEVWRAAVDEGRATEGQGRETKERHRILYLIKKGEGSHAPEFPIRGKLSPPPRHWPGAHCLPLFGKGADGMDAPPC